MKTLLEKLILAIPLFGCGLFLVNADHQPMTNLMGGICTFTGFLLILSPDYEPSEASLED